MKRLSEYFGQRVANQEAFFPGMSFFPRTTYAYNSSYTHSATGHTFFALVRVDPFHSSEFRYCSVFRTANSSNTISSCNVQPSDAPTGCQMFGRDNAGGVFFDIRCSDIIADGKVHSIFFAWDAATQSYVWKIDGKNATVTSSTINSATTPSGAVSSIGVGSNDLGTATVDYLGDIGFFFYDDQYLTNYEDFFNEDGLPRRWDWNGWTPIGGQPLVFSPACDVVRNNLGSLTFTENPTDTIESSVETIDFPAVPENRHYRSAYFPAMMEFDGATGYFSGSPTVSGNLVTVVLRVKMSPNAGTSDVFLMNLIGTGGTRVSLAVGEAGHATSDYANHLRCAVQSSVGVNVCRFYSNIVIADGKAHTVFFSYDGDNGEATFVIDGKPATNESAVNHNPPTTATLPTVSMTTQFGGLSGSNFVEGTLGFYGYRDAYLTNWWDFMDKNGNPKKLDTAGWTEWGAQPLFWNESGDMANNRGSGSNLTKNGTIEVANPDLVSIQGATMPGLLLYHVFDGPAGATPIGDKPLFCYDDQTRLANANGVPSNFVLNGSGYCYAQGGYSIRINPAGRWPEIPAGKVRCYRVWGRHVSPTSTSYMPTLQMNHNGTGSEFWSVRAMYNSAGYLQQYEWTGGAVGEGVQQSTTTASGLSGGYDFVLDVRDLGDLVIAQLQYIDYSSQNADKNVTQPQVSHLYKAGGRAYRQEQRFDLKWEAPSGHTNMLYRGIMIWDE